eukprot:Awhi_evm1s1420
MAVEKVVEPDTSWKAQILMRVHSKGSHKKTGRHPKLVAWFRGLSYWKSWCDFFPLNLEKTVDLDPKKNYLLGYHPHGIISNGCFGCFATEGREVSKLFPGLTFHLATLPPWFKLPFWREMVYCLGVVDNSRETFNHVLSGEGGEGQTIVIPLGGAPEALEAKPDTYDIILADKKGFVKVALVNGASLVPVFGFGENNLYTQKPNERGSEMRDWQEKILKLTSFAPVQLTDTIGLMPKPGLVTVVVGEPIDCPKTESPSAELIDEYHAKYIDGVKK